MRTIAAACAACAIAGCASFGRDDAAPVPVRTPAPHHYQSTVADYFDLMMPATSAQRRLAFGEPEASGCALFGTGGRHQGWMVPVIYDTAATPVAGKSGAAAARGNARATGGTGNVKTSAAGTSGTSGAPAASATATPPADGIGTATLQEVQVSGKGYFFWFSHDTIAAVTRRADGCPP